MAFKVSEEYLKRIRLAVREMPDEDLDIELTDLVNECRSDLLNLGVSKAKVEDETDPLILGAVRSFVRWKYGRENPDALANREDYMLQRDELRKRRSYIQESEGA